MTRATVWSKIWFVIAIGLLPTVGEFFHSPKNQTVDEGEKASLYCSTKEGPITTWKENDELLDEQDGRVSGGKTLGLYHSTLTIVGTSKNNESRFQCVSNNSEESGVATLFVRDVRYSGEGSTGNYSVENKNPVTTTVSDKNPVTTTVSDKNPVTTPVSAPDETNDSDVPGQDEKEPPQGKDVAIPVSVSVIAVVAAAVVLALIVVGVFLCKRKYDAGAGRANESHIQNVTTKVKDQSKSEDGVGGEEDETFNDGEAATVSSKETVANGAQPRDNQKQLFVTSGECHYRNNGDLDGEKGPGEDNECVKKEDGEWVTGAIETPACSRQSERKTLNSRVHGMNEEPIDVLKKKPCTPSNKLEDGT
jgi:hypothetical protein